MTGGGVAARDQRGLRGLWSWTFGAAMWRGPTLAGAWAVHAALQLVLLPLELWMIRGLTALQGRLTARLLGTDRSRWVLPVAILVAALGLLLLRGFINQA